MTPVAFSAFRHAVERSRALYDAGRWAVQNHANDGEAVGITGYSRAESAAFWLGVYHARKLAPVYARIEVRPCHYCGHALPPRSRRRRGRPLRRCANRNACAARRRQREMRSTP